MSKAVYFTGDGRLGNQLFQAAFLDGLTAPGDTIYATGMEEMLEGFDWMRVTVRNRRDSRSHQSAKRWIRRLGRLATKLRLIDGVSQPRQMFTVARESYKAHGGEVERRSGLSSQMLYVDKGYYQSAEAAEAASFSLKSKYKLAAQAFLDALPAGPKAFVHVRRGDYAKWEIFGRSPLLPLDYFKRGMEAITMHAPDVQFVLLSDDVDAVSAALEGVHVFRGANVYEDFGMMALCDGGVISNSTLSWWGGFFCRRTLPVISPACFLAHGLGFEYPVGITANWMTPIEP
ncbi:MAG: alpha-1,2-fucosyltransferase [Parvibaculaceae bacterium]